MAQSEFDERIQHYCKKRKTITENEEACYLEEVDYLCPLCGKHLMSAGTRKSNKDFQIAHIFPNSPTKNDMTVLRGVSLLGNDSESFDNKIALCKNDHWNYDQNKTREKYEKLYHIKQRLMKRRTLKKTIASLSVEEELSETIQKLSKLSPIDIDGLSLSYDALRIDEKIEDPYLVLRNEIEMSVHTYFPFIQKNIDEACLLSNSTAELVALSIRSAYLNCTKLKMEKTEIFDSLSEWISSKVDCSIGIARIIISFFVQNCEVYDKISK